MANSDQLISSLNILRRINPRHSEDIINELEELSPNLKEQIHRRTFVPFRKLFDDKESKYFLACDYNQNDRSYRSPWSNIYFPTPTKLGYFPNETFRDLEIDFNKLLEQYVQMYYRTGVSSAYLMETPSKNGFIACFCIKSELEDLIISNIGQWDSMHVIEVTQDASYVIYSSTSFLKIAIGSTNNDGTNQYDLGCNLDRYDKQKKSIESFALDNLNTHIHTIGEIIDEAENEFKTKVQQIFIPKIEEVVSFSSPYFEGPPKS